MHGWEMRQVLDSVSYQVGVRLEDFPRTHLRYTVWEIIVHQTEYLTTFMSFFVATTTQHFQSYFSQM